MTAPHWTRSGRGAGRRADVVLIAFHTGPLRDVPLSEAGFGLPGRDAVDRLDVRYHGAEALGWLDGFRRGALRTIATQDLGDLAILDAADGCVTVRADVSDPQDLVFLQAAWGVTRWLCARGAKVVLDARATRFWTSAGALAVAPDAPFDVRRELTVVAQTSATPGLGGHVLHTRGAVKVGCPDLVTVVATDDRSAATEALWDIAATLADGWVPATGEGFRAGVIPLFLIPAPPGSFVEALHLENDAMLVVGEDGAAPEWSRDWA